MVEKKSGHVSGYVSGYLSRERGATLTLGDSPILCLLSNCVGVWVFWKAVI